MATKNIVPRGNGEGSLGTSLKKWDRVYTNDVILADGESVTNKINAKSTKATTLAGYDIADAYTKTEADNRYLKLSGGTMSNTIISSAQNVIRKNTDNDALSIFGASAYDKGAYLELRGGENSERAGQAMLWARTASQSSSMGISPDGTTYAPTPATTDNSTRIATTAYVKSNLANYLPLSGGKTVTGGFAIKNSNGRIDFNPNGNIEMYSSIPFIDFHFNNSTEDYTTRIVEFQEGYLSAWSKDSSRSGYIETVVSSGTNYIRYGNGLQICWGILSIPANNTSGSTAQTVTYPQPFKTTAHITANTTGPQYNVNTWSSTTQMYYTTATNTTAFNISYITIGLWK